MVADDLEMGFWISKCFWIGVVYPFEMTVDGIASSWMILRKVRPCHSNLTREHPHTCSTSC